MASNKTSFKPRKDEDACPPASQRVEDKIAWMKEFLADYGLKVVTDMENNHG